MTSNLRSHPDHHPACDCKGCLKDEILRLNLELDEMHRAAYETSNDLGIGGTAGSPGAAPPGNCDECEGTGKRECMYCLGTGHIPSGKTNDDARDAERYRFLRGHGAILDGSLRDGRCFGIGLDAAVDAMCRSEKTEPSQCPAIDGPHRVVVGDICVHCRQRVKTPATREQIETLVREFNESQEPLDVNGPGSQS